MWPQTLPKEVRSEELCPAAEHPLHLRSRFLSLPGLQEITPASLPSLDETPTAADGLALTGLALTGSDGIRGVESPSHKR